MEKIKEILKKYYIYIVGIIGVIIILFMIFNPKEEKEDDSLESIINVEETQEEGDISETMTFKIDVKGEVINPGVYEVEEGMIVDDVIKMAGGLSNKASTDNINLSQKLVAEMVIVIASKEEVSPPKKSTVAVGAINSSQSNSNNTGKVSLNNATLEELMTLTGIGETKAQSIIEYRNGKKFTSIEEIKEVKGIGESTFAKIKNRLTL